MGIDRRASSGNTGIKETERSKLQAIASRLYFDMAGVVFIILNADGKIEHINKKGCEILGYSEEEIRGKDWFEMFIPMRVRERMRQGFRDFLSGNVAVMEFYENPVVTRQGREKIIVWHNKVLTDERGNAVGTLSSGEDVTRYKETEEILLRRSRQLELLSFVTQQINSTLDMNVLMRRLTASAMEMVLASGAAAGRYIDGKMVFREYRKGDVVTGIRLAAAPGEGTAGWVLSNKKPYITNDASRDPVIIPRIRESFGIYNLITVPIISRDGELLGCIELHNKEGRAPFDEDDLFILEGLAAAAAIAIENARIVTARKNAEEKLRESYSKLERISNEIISAIAKIVETRDPYTAGHQRRVGILASAIARAMELPEDRINGIRIAGMMHDVGKIYVPAEILNKPGRLTATEFEIIKIHPQAAYDTLKVVEFPWPVAVIAQQHQERLDGSGYPLGLSGENILLESRIVTVADVVEAMTFNRPYRTVLGIGRALEEIERNRGVLYDKDAVEVCLRLFREKKFSFI